MSISKKWWNTCWKGRLKAWKQKQNSIFPSREKARAEVCFVAMLQFLLISLLLVKNTGTADFIRSTVNWNQCKSILKTGVFWKCCCTQTWPFPLHVDEGCVIDLCFYNVLCTKLKLRKYWDILFQVDLNLQPSPLPLRYLLLLLLEPDILEFYVPISQFHQLSSELFCILLQFYIFMRNSREQIWPWFIQTQIILPSSETPKVVFSMGSQENALRLVSKGNIDVRWLTTHR